MVSATTELRRAYEACARSLMQGLVDLEEAEESGFRTDAPVFTVGRTAELAHVHPQTLRQYDRLGLVVPQRTAGGARRYCLRDIQRLAQAQRFSQEESINVAGIARILDLMEENRQLRRQVKRLSRPQGSSVFRADAEGRVELGVTEDLSRLAERVAHLRPRLTTYRLQITAAPDRADLTD